MARHARKQGMKRSFSFFLVPVLAFLGIQLLAPAGHAVSIFDATGVSFNFDRSLAVAVSGDGKTSGDIIRYRNVATIDGQSIDAVVVTGAQTGSTISDYDALGSAEGNATKAKPYFQIDTNLTTGGRSEFTFSFYEANTYSGPNTGQPVILKNVVVTSIDLDSGQYTEFTGFSTYRLADADPGPYASNLRAYTTDSDGTTSLAPGITRFTQLRGSTTTSSNDPQDAVEVKFNQITTFKAIFGHENNGTSYFGINFAPLCDTVNISNGCLTGYAAIPPAYNPANNPPTSTNDSLNIQSGVPTALSESDFGVYADTDANPFYSVVITTLPTSGSLQSWNGTQWIAVSLNDEILIADIQAGNLRFTGAADTTVGFKVADGIPNSISASAYTLTLNVRNQGQVITFANPGQKLPTDPAFASNASADSGLTVTLTSLTTGVCTVSGPNITPVSSGICTIVASQPGDSTYAAAVSVTQTFPISTLTPQTITFANPGPQTYAGTPVSVSTTPTATSNLTVSLATQTPSVCTVSGQTISVIGTGTCTIKATQAGNGTYAPAAPVTQSFLVSAGAPTYTLTYDGNSETSGSAPASQTGSGTITLAGQGTLVKTGFTFGGWSIGGVTFAGGDSYTLSATVTATAIWTATPAPASTPVLYALSYLAPSATSGSVPSTAYGVNATVSGNTGALTRDGYSFAGWTIDGIEYLPGASITLTASKVAYAYWIPNSIKFIDPETNEEVTQKIAGQNKVALPTGTQIQKPGYVLKGWLINEVEYQPGDLVDVAGAMSAMAIWEIKASSVDEVAGDELAYTGFESSQWLFIGLLLMGLGTASVLYARRRD